MANWTTPKTDHNGGPITSQFLNDTGNNLQYLKNTKLDFSAFIQTAIWSGAVYLNSGQTVTPTNTLSQCNNGWILLWSDFDVPSTPNNWDWAVTFIPKGFTTLRPGEQMLHSIPNFATTDGAGQIVKKLLVYDDRIVGDDANGSSTSGANDVCLRYILPF